MEIRKSAAVVLRSVRYSNTSKIVTFFTEEYGRVAAVAKGARRTKSKFGAGLEPFLVSEIIYYHRDGRGLQLLTDADVLVPFQALRRDLVRRVYGYAVCELLGRMTEDRCPELFRLAVNCLKLLELVPDRALTALYWSFQLKMYAFLGFRPHLHGCHGCGTRFGPGGQRPVIDGGGLICAVCAGDDMTAATVSSGTAVLLARLLDDSPAAVAKYGITAAQRSEGAAFFDYYLRYHSGSGRGLVSLRSLDDLTAMEA